MNSFFNRIIIAGYFMVGNLVGFSQVGPHEVLDEIQNKIAAGLLHEADSLQEAFLSDYTSADTYLYNRLKILDAHIAEGYGDEKAMFAALQPIDYKHAEDEIQFYWLEAFARYCFLNQQWDLGADYLHQSIAISKNIKSDEVNRNALINELYLIYYTQDVEVKLDKGIAIPERVTDIFSELDETYTSMAPFEKQKFLSYKIYFASTRDTLLQFSLSENLLNFGIDNKSPRACILAYTNYSRFCCSAKDSLKSLSYLQAAERESEKIQTLRDIIECKYRLMRHFRERQRYAEAIFWGKQAIFPPGKDFSTHFDTYGQLSAIYEEMGRMDSALYYKKIDYQKYKDISRAHDNNMQSFFINKLHENIEAQDSQIRKNFVLITVLSFAIAIIFFLFLKNRQTNWSIGQKNKSLERSNQLLENFSHLLSHDLRAPMYSIKNLATYILEEEKNLSPDSIENLNLIQQASNNSTLLITNIMTFIRSKEIEIEHKIVSLQGIFEKVEENLHELIRFNKTRITYTKLPHSVYGNEILLVQLFQNIVQNAIKYAKEGQAASISISYVQFEKQGRITIKDEGIGIEAANLKNITEAFKQVQFDSIESGIGLGLSISSTIVKLHKGRIEFESTYGQGTMAHLFFPRTVFDL